MADGYARLTGKPQCVIVHVDVGTQGLGAAVHNASTGRAPVLVFAGLSPFTLEGEMRGSRTEYIHWIQNVPDQTQIIGQYCRYAGEIKTGKNIKQMVNRALQFATSDPQGPVYLVGAREVMEEEITPYSLEQGVWDSVELGGLTPKASKEIAEALLGAENPLLITGYSGRNQKIPAALVELANTVKGLRVLDTGGSDMCFPASHPGWLGLRFGIESEIEKADVIVIVDCDVPWIPTLNKPKDGIKVFHIDVDPLKQLMPLFYVPAQHRYRADALVAVEQITSEAQNQATKLDTAVVTKKWEALQASHKERLATIASKTIPAEDGSFGTGHLCKTLKSLCPEDTIWAIEAVTNTGFVHDNLQPELPGSWINCGGGGLGWSGGGALGIKLATDAENGGKGKFVVQIVGDGTFLFSVPGSVYWISRRYKIPVLTIVLNNKGELTPLFLVFRRHVVCEEILIGEENRLERPSKIDAPRTPRRTRLQGDKRRDQYLVRSCARLFRHRKGGCWRRLICREGGQSRGFRAHYHRGYQGSRRRPECRRRLQSYTWLLIQDFVLFPMLF